jgi:hypothetical protein
VARLDVELEGSEMKSASWIGAAVVLGLGLGALWLATELAAAAGLVGKK